MAKKSKRPILVMNEEEIKRLENIANSRILPRREVERSQILLLYYKGFGIQDIATKLSTSRPTVYKCIDKAISMGPQAGLKDLPHRSKEPEITLEAKAWVTNLACTQPKDLGVAAEVWSRQSLADYVKKHAAGNGHPSLGRASKATVHRILKENKLQPHKIKYYLEKRDPEFENKMREVLLVYQHVDLENKKDTKDRNVNIVTVCVDEKPGVQAIANTAPDLALVPGKYTTIARDHEYVRHGTASILVGIDLHDGHIFAQVQRRHRSCEFIEFLKELDDYYAEGVQIRIILDNHSSHISKETMKYLATRPGRFIYIRTPTHGSWLNLAETLFGKMARSFLRHIRVKSWTELKERILKGVDEFNQNPVVFRWTKFELLDQSM